MSFNRDTPYNSLPELPPSGQIESIDILKKCISVTRSLAELKDLGKSIPNQAILIDSIVMQEARFSSEIENIVTTNDRLYKAASKEYPSVDPSTKEVLNYRAALKYGFEYIQNRPLNKSTLIEITRILTNRRSVIRSVPGTKIVNPESGEVFYTPPEGKQRILGYLANLEDFLHKNTGLDPLVKMCIAHYQFEAIHPFYDGNGRAGRIMNILYLVSENLLDLPVLYLSRYIIDNKQKYYLLLREVTEKNYWKKWILFLLEGIEQMSDSTAAKIREIHNLFLNTLEQAKKKLPAKVYSKELIEMIYMLPYIRISNLVEHDIAKRQTASEYLKALSDAGFLKLQTEGKEKIYINTELLSLLQKDLT